MTPRAASNAGLIFALLVAFVLPRGGMADETAVPLGDGRISTSPAAGYIYSCQQRFGGSGAFRDGDWIAGNVWYPDRKIHVSGDVAWPASGLSVTVENGLRQFRADGLPDHPTGEFPVQPSDPAYQYDRNPNAIHSHPLLLSLPAAPEIADAPFCLPMGMIGFSLGGVAIFNGLDAGGRDAVAHEIQDKCGGHPQPQGQYHYHGYSPCMKEAGAAAGGHSGLVGYALDGFGIYGARGEAGREVTNADLDACHGHTHAVLWNGRMQVVYHYHMTREYPYSLGCFKGKPVTAQAPRQQQGGAQTQAGPDHRRILNQAAQTLGIDPETLRQAIGPPPPDFARAAQQLGLPEEQIRAAFDAARQGP